MYGPASGARLPETAGMDIKTAVPSIVSFLILYILVAPAPAGEHQGHHARGSFASGMHESMKVMMRDMEEAPMTGDPDKDFLSMMIPHHQGAVEMARLVLLHGRDPLVRRLAEEIIAGQTVEIEAMKRRLRIIGPKPEPDPGGFPALGGTRGPAGD